MPSTKFHAFILLLASLFLIAACQTTGERDSGGALIDIKKDDEATILDARINIPLFLDLGAEFTYEKEIRDNGKGIIETYVGDGLYIYSQYVTRGWYSRRSLDTFKLESSFKESISDLSEAKFVRPLNAGLKATGHYAELEDGCMVMMAAKQIRDLVASAVQNSKENLVLTVRDCNDFLMATPEEFLAGLDQMKKADSNNLRMMMQVKSDITKELKSSGKAVENRRNITLSLPGNKVLKGTSSVQRRTNKTEYTNSILTDEAGNRIECTGFASFDKDPTKGEWSNSCDNGLVATGSYSYNKASRTTFGEGMDKDGNKITFVIIP